MNQLQIENLLIESRVYFGKFVDWDDNDGGLIHYRDPLILHYFTLLTTHYSFRVQKSKSTQACMKPRTNYPHQTFQIAVYD